MPAVLSRFGLRRLAALAALTLLSAFGALFVVSAGNDARGATGSNCSKVDEVTFGSSPSGAYAPPQVAAALGLFKKYCVKLVSLPISSAAVSLAQTVAGRQDMALLNPTGFISAVAQGQKLKAI